MALELVAAIVAGVALAGIAMILRRLSGGRLPKWIVSVAAGAGLIGFTIWSEYDWFSRVSAELPEGVPVVWSEAQPMPLRPWTYLAPLTTRFVAMDLRKGALHPDNPALRMVPVYSFARWRPVDDGVMVFDCAAGRQVLLREGLSIGTDGALTGGDWVTPPAGDGFQAAACGTG